MSTRAPVVAEPMISPGSRASYCSVRKSGTSKSAPFSMLSIRASSGTVRTTSTVAGLSRPMPSFGEQALLSPAAVRTASAVALDATETSSLHRREFEGLRASTPASRMCICAQISRSRCLCARTTWHRWPARRVPRRTVCSVRSRIPESSRSLGDRSPSSTSRRSAHVRADQAPCCAPGTIRTCDRRMRSPFKGLQMATRDKPHVVRDTPRRYMITNGTSRNCEWRASSWQDATARMLSAPERRMRGHAITAPPRPPSPPVRPLPAPSRRALRRR